MRDGLEGFNVNRALAGAAYRSDIDGLRALAVLPVVLYHAGIPGFSGGFVGVDVFFVISGYLITGIIAREVGEGRFSYIDFYERRARRIMPALLFVLAVASAGAWAILFPEQLRAYGVHLLATLGFVANLVFMQEIGDYFSPDAEFAPLLHMWSLGVEEQFYILFPILLALGARLGTKLRDGLVIAACLASFALAVWLERVSPTHAFYFTGTRVWELGLGALLALGWFAQPVSRVAREAIAVVGLVLIAAPVALYDAGTPFPGAAALAPCLGAAMLIAVGRRDKTRVGRLLSAPPLVIVGLISFSLYLWHWPILALMRVRLGAVDLPPTHATAAVAASVALAVLSWAVVERPFRDRRRVRPAAVFATAGVGAAAAAAFAGVTVLTDGAPGRLPPDVAATAAATTDGNPLRDACVNRSDPADYCRLGLTDGPADFLVWGDSHADALMPAFAAAADATGLPGRIAIRTGCPPILGVRRDVRRWRACVAHNDAVIAHLRESDEARTVFLVARWAIHETGFPPGGGGAPVRLLDIDPAASDTAEGSAFARGLARTVAAIRETGREVILVGSAPELDWSAPLAVAAAQWRGAPIPSGPDLAAVRARNADVDAAFAVLAAADPGVTVASLADRLCAPACALADRGAPLYRDDNHLSRHGAEAVVAPVLIDHLSSLLER
jgi:peptidoglycan/LPS O-acetylase OafA/YrhL